MTISLPFLPPFVGVESYPDRAAWFSARRAGTAAGQIGSTDVAAILGWSKYRTAWDVFVAGLTDAEEDSSEPAEHLARGLAMEPMLWALYRERYGVEAIEPGHIRVARGRFVVSPDSFVHDMALGWGIGEGKTVLWNHAHWVPYEDVVIEGLDALESWPMPRAYLAQCLSMCLACGLPFCDLWVAVVTPVEDQRCAIATEEYPDVSPHAIQRTVRIRVIPTRDDLVALVARLNGWVQRHLVERIPPPDDDSKACYLYHLGPDPADRVTYREAEPDEAEIIAEILQADDEKKAAENRWKQARARLVGAMGDAKSVYVKTTAGNRIKATVSTRGVLTVKEPTA